MEGAKNAFIFVGTLAILIVLFVALSFNKKNTTTYSPSQTVERVEYRNDKASYSEPSSEKNNKGVRNPDSYPQTSVEKPHVKEKPAKIPTVSKEEREKDYQQSIEDAAWLKYNSQFRNPSMAVTLPREAYNVQRVQMGDVGKSKYDYGIKENANYETYVNNRALQQSGLEKVATKVKKKIQE